MSDGSPTGAPGSPERKTHGACPACGGVVVPVVYGMPPEELGEAEQRRELVLAGCVIPSRHHDRGLACRDCGHRLPDREAWSDGLVERAFVLAAEAHAGQRRKGTPVPYLSHPMAVASLVMGYGGTPVQAAAALLHDVVEDSGLSPRGVRDRFGEDVAGIVVACTDAAPAPGEPKPPWHERKSAYVEGLRTVPGRATMVIACDKLHNARSILSDHELVGDDVWERFSQGPGCTAWYYGAVGGRLADRLRAPGPRPHQRLARELTTAVDRVVALAQAAAGDTRCRLSRT